jgi:hypothetical protein
VLVGIQKSAYLCSILSDKLLISWRENNILNTKQFEFFFFFWWVGGRAGGVKKWEKRRKKGRKLAAAAAAAAAAVRCKG